MKQHSMMKRTANSCRLFLPLMLAVMITGCFGQEGRSVASKDFASEWAEVQALYPHVARAYITQQSLESILPRDTVGAIKLKRKWFPTLCELERESLIFISREAYLSYCDLNLTEPGTDDPTICKRNEVSCTSCNPTESKPCRGCNTWGSCQLSGGPEEDEPLLPDPLNFN